MKDQKTSSQNACTNQKHFEQYKLQIIAHHILEKSKFEIASRYCEHNNMSLTFINASSMKQQSSHHKYTMTPYFRSSSIPNHSYSYDWNDKEAKRKSRVNVYRSYSIKTKAKDFFKNGSCWIKNKTYRVIQG